MKTIKIKLKYINNNIMKIKNDSLKNILKKLIIIKYINNV